MHKPTLVIIGQPPWLGTIREQLTATYRVESETDRCGYIARLADTHAALILVDGAVADWRWWTTSVKANNATRRIPVIVVSIDVAARHEALLSGGDLALSPAQLVTQISTLIRDYARVEDPARVEQLNGACQEPLPPLAAQGIERFNAGEYYRQHDLFEAQWARTDGPVRDLYRAILQVGVAYYQIERGNYRGALKMLLRSVQWLLILPDVCQGVDVQQLRADSFRVRAELEAMNPAAIAQFDRGLLKPVKRVDSR